jgi:transposase InsO family protein
MARLIDEHGAPEHIRSDNGSEFIESNLREWLANEGIKTLYIDPGSPWQNGSLRASMPDSERNVSTVNNSGH